MSGRLQVVPVVRDDALEFVRRLHRHATAPQGYRFALGAAVGDELVGVAIVGRPVARHLDDGWTQEVLRNCTDGTKNACSFLYGACWRAARALGYRKLVTYTLASESGSSLRASGFVIVGEVRKESWHRANRPRFDKHELQTRLRWEVSA